MFVLPSTGFELTPLINCNNNRLALYPGLKTTRSHLLDLSQFSIYCRANPLSKVIYLQNSTNKHRYNFRVRYCFCKSARFMVFKVTFNNISVISWRTALLVEDTGGPAENNLNVRWNGGEQIQSQNHKNCIMQNMRINLSFTALRGKIELIITGN